MLIKEYRITMPCTVDEYFVGQLHMTAKSSQQETGKNAGEGVEIVANEPYELDAPHNMYNMPAGQFTHKIMHFRSKLPSMVAMLVPVSLTYVEEKSWNAFPHTKTVYSNEFFGEKFSLSVETIHANDSGNQENAVGLPHEDLNARIVDYIDIAAPDSSVKFAPGENPSNFKSAKTGRGPLAPGFRNSAIEPLMTCYKVCKLRFKVYGLQTKVESWGHSGGLRTPFLQYHRKIFCWIDEWFGMSIADIRAMEEETARITKQKLADSAGDTIVQSATGAHLLA
jgi:Phosphatidylinositol transfer protein